ncbi:MAG TPA: MFS transporter [Methylocystis sp.]|nr:MFS transporter [Methylocystis sp.]
MQESSVKRFLPWVVASSLFMEQLDSTIVNTAVPAMAESLHVAPLSLKAVVASYILSLAVFIPVSGWTADRYGARRVFFAAVALFTLSSVFCGLAINAPELVVARVLQGAGAAMMTPVGRLAIVRTFPKSELLGAMNFVIIPALMGPLLGPTVGGLIVHWLSWREIFFVNVPVGLAALALTHRYMPDYYGDEPRPLDVVGLLLFGSGTAIISWLLEIFGEHEIGAGSATGWAAFALLLLGLYWRHARRAAYPLLRLSLFEARTFRVSVAGGFITRLGVGGLPFLTPLLLQLGLGLPAWESGLLMMPTAAAAMGMKFISARVLKLFGYRAVLIVNTLMIGATIALYALVTPQTPLVAIVSLGFLLGFFNSLQFSSMNSMAYADVEGADSSMAATIASSFQQISMSFGLACGTLVAAFALDGLPQTNREAIVKALHVAYLALGAWTAVSSLSFWTLRAEDGENISRHGLREMA